MQKFTKRQMTDYLTALEAARRDGLAVNETDYDSGIVVERISSDVDISNYAVETGFKTVGGARFWMATEYGFTK